MMKCMFLHNEGVISILLLLTTTINCSFVGESFQTIQELCTSNRYIFNLQPGESHQVRLVSENSGRELNKWYQKQKRRCRKEFKANNGASHFSILISNITIPSCSEKCQCNYFEITEPGREERFCGKFRKDLYFESKHDYLTIEIHHGMSMQFDVTLTFTVERNTYIITGLPKGGLSSGHFLETPFFPNAYPSDYTADYVLQSDDPSGHVMLMFLDFQIAPESFIEVEGHNGTHPEKFTGSFFRPPVIVSQKHQLSLKFAANKQVRTGFRAVCFFVRDADITNSVPFTRCGGLKEGYGGVISLDVRSSENYYDCMWLVFPPVFPLVKPYFLSVLNISLENIGTEATLEFREGLNSKSKLVKSSSCDSLSCTPPSEVTVTASSGLYIRFNGFLRPDSVVRMVYHTYHTGNCTEADVLCYDRCLSPLLRCDGVDHCEDGKDERGCTTSTIPPTTPITISKKRIHNSNTFASFMVVLSIGICGIVLVIVVVIIAVYRHVKVLPLREDVINPAEIVIENAGPIQPPRDLPPSYEFYMRSSDRFPPLLFTRADKRYSEPSNVCLQHTTSFCGHPTTGSFDLHSLGSSNCSDASATAAAVCQQQPGCSFSRCGGDYQWIFDTSKEASGGLRKSASFGSSLDKNCVHLSITHSINSGCKGTTRVKHNSCPARVRKQHPNHIELVFHTFITNPDHIRKHSCSSCIVCRDSVTIKSEILATLKTRCNSDPCSQTPSKKFERKLFKF